MSQAEPMDQQSTEAARTETAEVVTGAAEAVPGKEADLRIAELELQVAELERRVTKEREAATDYMNRWQRAQADFANFKRRAQQEEQQREALVTWRTLA